MKREKNLSRKFSAGFGRKLGDPCPRLAGFGLPRDGKVSFLSALLRAV